METRSNVAEKAQAERSAGQGAKRIHGWPKALLVFGAVLLLTATLGAAYALLQHWLQEQDRYLWAQGTAPAPVPGAMEGTAEAIPSGSTVPAEGGAVSTPEVAAPEAPAQPTARPRAVQIRIPSIGVTRSIVNAPRIRDSKTGAWTWNVDRLLRQGRPDLVGHLEGSANPGEEGNMVLAGHNYGYGVNGVFLRLSQLTPGKRIYVVNKEGETFTYRIVEVERVRWRGNKEEQLAEHWKYLALGGQERLTLMTCGGAGSEPFPERIYVVAEPLASSAATSP